jgi:hypothetical protein
MPILFKCFKQYTLIAASLLGTALFFALEIGLEQIKVIEGYIQMPLQSWQLSLCMETPEVLRSIGEPIYAADNPAFKIHFYVIALVIILTVLYMVYSFSKMLRDQDFTKRHLLITQAVAAAVFIGLCIFACFTAFYRNGTLNISPLSALLMSIFFMVFGVTAGIYCGSIFYGKSKILAKVLPAIAASITILVMYLGEQVMMDGTLFKYGKGFFFEPIVAIPFAPIDILIILAGGLGTYIILTLFSEENSNT